jgi:membrane protein implicated in regulation of membrane protease activity
VAALIWLVAGILLAAAEVATGDFFLLMLSGGALATAGFAGITGGPVWLDAVVFAIVSIGLVVGVRPSLLRKVRRGAVLPTNTAALLGKKATVLARVDAHGGQVKLGGEVWSARPHADSQVFELGRTVIVVEIDGATAVISEEP